MNSRQVITYATVQEADKCLEKHSDLRIGEHGVSVASRYRRLGLFRTYTREGLYGSEQHSP